MSKVTSKVLQFSAKQGDVGGHEVACYSLDPKDPIEYLLFWTFDSEAQTPVEILVHWTEATKYMKRKWPKYGEVKAVILRSGRRIHAKSYSIAYYDAAAYLAAPIIARDAYKVTTLDGGHRLWEVVGVEEWAYSNRGEEAMQRLLACPWKRDNEAFHRSQMQVA